MAQYILIEQVWDNSKFHCPVCGAPICSADSLTDHPCPHLLFSWIDEVGEYENLSPSLEEKIDFEEVIGPWDEDLLNKLPATAVVFAFEIRDMACGPITHTVAHAINFPE
jgi:hypothetical protein